MTSRSLNAAFRVGLLALLFSPFSQPAAAATTQITPALGATAGMRDNGPAAPATLLRLAIEFQPRGNLEALAAQVADPTSPQHRTVITAADEIQRFGRISDGAALSKFFRDNGANNLSTSRDGLVVTVIASVELANRLFHTRYDTYTNGTRTVIAPAMPLVVPAANVRDVRGAVAATTPRLNDVRTPYTGFRGDWYLPTRFREMYDALPDGGDGQRIVLIEDASDVFDIHDVEAFLSAPGAPPGASISRLSDQRFAFKTPSQDCGRDDRGQETALDIDAAMTMAPRAQIIIAYDDVCSPGNDGTGAVARALELDPSVIVFPFSVGPVRATGVAATYGLTPLPYLEAILRGIPIVVSAGDDGAYGFRQPGIDEAAVTWPCVLTVVMCAGGTQLGDRDTIVDEGPWNDAVFAGSGGISTEPRPAWQSAPSTFEFSPGFIKNRMVPDISADAAGHLRIFWHGYGLGGVGGTSESASVVAGQLAAINSVVPSERRLRSTADLYTLASAHPEAYRDIKNENDRRYLDNTLRPRRVPPPKGYRGILATPTPPVLGCRQAQSDGCSVKTGYDAVTGIGSLKEQTAARVLRQ